MNPIEKKIRSAGGTILSEPLLRPDGKINEKCANQLLATLEHSMKTKEELTAWLDTQEITSDNIGDIRRSLFRADGKWNSMVRDETASREKLPNRATTCPQCGTGNVVQCRETGDYCEDCGWPNENRPV